MYKNYKGFYAFAAYAAPDALCFCHARRGFCLVPSVFFSIRKNSEPISMKFAGGNQYHQRIEWLHFWRN